MARDYKEIPAFVLGLYADMRDVLFETASHVKDRMSEEGKPVRYPIDWDSPRQKRAYFATNGFGRGIPYKRTNKYPLGWQLQRVSFGTNLSNRHPAGAVGGLPSGWQSRIHRNRWPHLLTVLFEELARVPAAVSNKFSVRAGRQ